MATRDTIRRAVHDDLVAVLDSNTGVASPAEHVGVENPPHQDRQPFCSYNDFPQPVERGLGGDVHVDHVTYSGGEAQTIVFRRDTRLRFDITTQTRGETAKNELYTALLDNFEAYQTYLDPTDLHPDAQRVETADTSEASREDDPVQGDTIRVTVEYGRYTTWDGFEPTRNIDTVLDDLSDDFVYKTFTTSN